jgi:hypothetical protein
MMPFKLSILAFLSSALFVTAIVTHAAAQHSVSIQTDGRDEVHISNGSLIVEHFSWSQPNNLLVDGVPKTLSWNGNTTAPIAVPISGNYWVKKTVGRDGAYAVQRSDGFALAVSDNPNGADLYEFQLFAAPEANTTDWMHVIGAGATPGRMNFIEAAGYAPQPLFTETTFSLTVDGTDELMFVNGSLVIRHLSWNQPAALTINGVPQSLNFTGSLSNPIALSLPERFQFSQLGGRTQLYPTQTPVGLLIGASDELLGADAYTWKLVSIPEPVTPAAVLIVIIALFLARRPSGSRLQCQRRVSR